MSNWLDGQPFMRNGLMLNYNYNYQTDDSENITVHTYPKVEYIGKFASSRFSDDYIQEMYPEPDKNGFRTVGEFIIRRELYPSIDKSQKAQWMEKIVWGIPDLVVHKGEHNTKTYFSVFSGEPKPFEDIVEHILKNNSYGD